MMKITEGQSIIVTVSHWETTKRHDENEGNEGNEDFAVGNKCKTY
jgi:hypothetical protein